MTLVVRGWLADHEWRVLAASLLGSVLVPLGVNGSVDSPLGDGYAGINLPIALVLLSAGGLALALRSRAATTLAISPPAQYRAAWLATTGAAALLCTLLAAGGSPAHLVHAVNVACLVGFGAALLALVAGEGAALTWVFVCFVASIATPRFGPAPWWSPILFEGGVIWRLTLSAALTLSTAWMYVTGPGRLQRPWAK